MTRPHLGGLTLLGLVIVACGSRSGVLEDGDDTERVRVIVVPGPDHSTASPGDAGAPQPDATTTDAEVPPLPCHLVRTGEPFQTIAFEDPAFAFHHDGVVLRGPSGAGRGVVQYGNVTGMRKGVWDDPPIFAAEYDVRVWPPKVVHPATQLFHSMHEPADLQELPGGKLALTWYFDGDGAGPRGARYRTIDGTSWGLGPDRFLVENAAGWTRPVVTRENDQDLLVTTYSLRHTDDAGVGVVSWLGTFDVDGNVRGEALPLWTRGGDYTAFPPTESVARTRSGVLVALGFPSCTDGTAGPYCTPNAIVMLRLSDPGPKGRLERTAVIPVRDPSKLPSGVKLLADSEDHVWLTWWEIDRPTDGGASREAYLYALPLTNEGHASGPIERWFVADAQTLSDYYATRAPKIGPLGTFYPVNVSVPKDGGATDREIHLLHRQLDVMAPLEDIVLTTRLTGWPVGVIQIPETRSVVVSYSTYPADNQQGYGELVKYGCREDAR